MRANSVGRSVGGGIQQRLRRARSARAVLEILVPGRSRSAETLRAKVARVAEDPVARACLLTGASGSGKSTLARALALCRALSLCDQGTGRRLLATMRFQSPALLAVAPLHWYREISLPGLVSTLADAQLFGVMKGAASDVVPREGVFRGAMAGSIASARHDSAALLNGGVVFLDEIGDLEGALQSKLLAVLAGGTVYPLGGEGDPRHAYAFEGLTIAATWRPEAIRDDLLGRFRGHVIHVPSLSDRMEDFDAILMTVIHEIQCERSAEADRMCQVAGAGEDAIEALRQHREVAAADRALLACQDWGALGDLRGLVQVVRRIVGKQVDAVTAIAEQTAEIAPAPQSTTGARPHVLLAALLDRPSSGPGGLVHGVRQCELASRMELADLLRRDVGAAERVARHFHLSPRAFRKALFDLGRSRTKRRRGQLPS